MNFTGIWGVYEFQNKYVITGKNGTALFYNGAAWQQDTTGTDEDLYGALYADYDNIYAIGGLGRLLHRDYEDTGWEMNLSGAGETLRSIWGYSPTNIFIAGDNGIIMTYNPQQGTINRLLCEHRKTEEGATIYKIEYIFDDNQSKNGNIHQIVVNDTDTTTFTYNEMNELTGITHPDSSTETLTYDNNGNLTQISNNTTGEITTLSWTIFNNLSKITFPDGHCVENEYDGYGQITGQKVYSEDRTFIQRNWNIIREELSINGNNKVIDKIYTIKPNGNILSFTVNGELYCLHPDHLGTVHFLTDRFGNKINTGQYTGYGSSLPLEKSGNPGAKENRGALNINTLGFVAALGIRNEFRMKMHYMRSRFYSAMYNRFISVDKKRDGLNHFSYTDGNPISYIDAFGYSKAFYINPNAQSSTGIEKRKEILSKLYNKFHTRYEDLQTWGKERRLRCGDMIEFLSDAINELLKLDCIFMENFVDIFGLMSVDELPVPFKEESTIIPTMYPSRYEKGLNKKYSLHGCWEYEDFWDKYKDSEGFKSDQVHHYLAYVFIAFRFTTEQAGRIATFWHDLDHKNMGDIRLGYLGAKVGKFLLKVKDSCLERDLSNEISKNCLRKKRREVLNEFGKACVTGTYEWRIK